MKCLALFLLVIQAEKVSSCVFDKVEKLNGIDDVKELENMEKNECFAECYNDKSCIALRYFNRTGYCFLFFSGSETYKCSSESMCYLLQREEVDLTCQTYLNI